MISNSETIYYEKKYLDFTRIKKYPVNGVCCSDNGTIVNTHNNMYDELDISLLDLPGLGSSDDEETDTKKEKNRNVFKNNLSSFELSKPLTKNCGKNNEWIDYKNINNIISDFSDDEYLCDINNSHRDTKYFFKDKKLRHNVTKKIYSNDEEKFLNKKVSNVEENIPLYITNSLDNLNIYLKNKDVNRLSEIVKNGYYYNNFNSPVQLNNVSLDTLLKYKNFSLKVKEFFYDKIAQMIFALSYIVQKNGMMTCENYCNLFFKLYQIDKNIFKKWTELTFIEFMCAKWCSPYFKVVFDKIRHEYVVEKFNETNKTLLNTKNISLITEKKNDKITKDEIDLTSLRLNYACESLEVLEEKVKWYMFLSYRPEGLNIIPLSIFCHNFKDYFNFSLNRSYLKSKFKQNCLPKVLNHCFPGELKLTNEHSNYFINVLCEPTSKIETTKKIIKYMTSKENKEDIIGNYNFEMKAKTPLLNIKNDSQKKDFEISGIINEKMAVNEMVSNNLKPIHKVKKPEYVNSNVMPSDDEESSDNEQ